MAEKKCCGEVKRFLKGGTHSTHPCNCLQIQNHAKSIEKKYLDMTFNAKKFCYCFN